MPKKGEAVSFEPNDLIFAKVKGYPCWPACVTQATDEKKNKYSVYFYGTYETAIVKKDEMFPFNEATKSKYGKNKKKDFGKAMEEIENTPEIGYGIPIIDSGKAPLEGGISGDTLLDDSSMETSVTEEKSPVEEEAVEENTEEPHAEEAKTEPEISEPEKPKKVEKPKAEKAAKASKKVAEEKAEPVKTETPKPAKKGTKRKASTSNAPKETDSPLTPVVKQPKLSTSTPVSTPVNAEEKTSRSGRVIKPKKFEDEADSAKDKTAITPRRSSTLKVDENSTPKGNAKKVDNKKIWVQVSSTGDSIEIDLDKKKPQSFDSKEQEIEWDRQSAKNALKFKDLVESGQFIPDEIFKKLEAKVKRTPEEEEILRQALEISNFNEKIRWIQVEKKMYELDVAIKMALHYLEPDMERCLSLMDELNALAIQPLMLKKNPDIVTTLRKLRKYIGPKDQEEDDKTEETMGQIRSKANEIYEKFQDFFKPPSNVRFSDFFQELVDQFRNATQELEPKALGQLVIDPTLA